jgi:hypothetical protein
MPKGEKILSPKQKDRTTTISKILEMKKKSNWYSQKFVLQLVFKIILNWYEFSKLASTSKPS